MKTDSIQLKHSFTDAEMAAMAREQASALDKIGELESHLDAVKKQLNADIGAEEARLKKLSGRIHGGWEIRDVKCLLLDDRLEGFRISVRLDTGHIAKRRKLEGDERQLTLTTEPPKPFIFAAVLHVDDEGWDVEAFELPIHEDEFDALKELDVIRFQPWVPRVALAPANENGFHPVAFTERMRAAKTADEGREIIQQHTMAIAALEKGIGLVPSVGPGAHEGRGSVSFSVLTAKEHRQMIKRAKEKDAAAGEKIAALIKDGLAMKEPWEALYSKELRDRFSPGAEA